MIRFLSTLVFLFAAFAHNADAAANQRSCPASVPLNMTIDYGDDANTNCQLTSLGQTAIFAFQGNAGDNITIVANTSGFWPCIDLYDPTNKQVSTKCAYNYNVASSGSKLAVTGQYTIRIHDANYNGAGTFGLMLDCWYPTVVASQVTLGQPSSGNRPYSETIDDWTFSGSAGEDITFQVNTNGNWPCLTVVQPNGVQLTPACAFNNTQIRSEYTLQYTGTYAVIVNDANYEAAGTYSLALQCLASCTAPGPVYPSVNVTLTGCTTACATGNTFSATLSTVNFPNKTTELKLGFTLPDGTTAAVGDPHLEIPGNYTFNGQVLSGPIVAAHPRGSWSLCARIVELNHGQTLAASCQSFTIK